MGGYSPCILSALLSTPTHLMQHVLRIKSWLAELLIYGRVGHGASSISSTASLDMTSLDCIAGTLLPR